MSNRMSTIDIINVSWVTKDHIQPPDQGSSTYGLGASYSDGITLRELEIELRRIKNYENGTINQRGYAMRDVDIFLTFVEPNNW